MTPVVDTKHAIVSLLYNTEIHFSKTYSWMAIATIKKHLDVVYRIKRCERTVKYHLKKIREEGLFKYYPRKCGRKADGTVFLRPPNRSITLLGLRWLKKKGVTVATWLWNHLIGKNKIPRGKGPDSPFKKQQNDEKIITPPNGVRKLINSIGKKFVMF